MSRSAATVLLVEDELAVRTFVAEALAQLGCSVIEADSAETGIAQLRAHDNVTVLLTDVRHARQSGRELAELARAHKPDIRVLYMTGYNAQRHRSQRRPRQRHAPPHQAFTLGDLEMQLRRLLSKDPL